MGDEPDAAGRLRLLARVRCLECGLAYAKPARGGTIETNPGCPRCGSVGWMPADVEVMQEPDARPSRSDADRRQSRGGRSR